MNAAEQAILFPCEGARLVGVLHRPAAPRSRGVLIVVGGPQYRIGSHRQFVLMARVWASLGIPVLRFDYRGMGDSDDPAVSFEHTGPDIEAALDTFFGAVPELREVVIWGLCDAASAALIYAPRDARVRGLVLANPWVRAAQSEARAQLRHYYLARLTDLAQWRRILTGKINPLRSMRDLYRTFRTGVWPAAGGNDLAIGGEPLFVARMREGLERFEGSVLVILSGDDLTAAEFGDSVRRSPEWGRAMDRESLVTRELAGANHTFSRRLWRQQVTDWTRQWLESW